MQGSFYELKMKKNSPENFGTLDFSEIWPASSMLHLIARKNQCPAKEDQELEFPLKMEFGLILL
jgi:hypothetical protein